MTSAFRTYSLFPALICAALSGLLSRPVSAQTGRPSVFQTTLEEANQLTPEITTE